MRTNAREQLLGRSVFQLGLLGFGALLATFAFAGSAQAVRVQLKQAVTLVDTIFSDFETTNTNLSDLEALVVGLPPTEHEAVTAIKRAIDTGEYRSQSTWLIKLIPAVWFEGTRRSYVRIGDLRKRHNARLLDGLLAGVQGHKRAFSESLARETAQAQPDTAKITWLNTTLETVTNTESRLLEECRYQEQHMSSQASSNQLTPRNTAFDQPLQLQQYQQVTKKPKTMSPRTPIVFRDYSKVGMSRSSRVKRGTKRTLRTNVCTRIPTTEVIDVDRLIESSRSTVSEINNAALSSTTPPFAQHEYQVDYAQQDFKPVNSRGNNVNNDAQEDISASGLSFDPSEWPELPFDLQNLPDLRLDLSTLPALNHESPNSNDFDLDLSNLTEEQLKAVNWDLIH